MRAQPLLLRGWRVYTPWPIARRFIVKEVNAGVPLGLVPVLLPRHCVISTLLIEAGVLYAAGRAILVSCAVAVQS